MAFPNIQFSKPIEDLTRRISEYCFLDERRRFKFEFKPLFKFKPEEDFIKIKDFKVFFIRVFEHFF